MTEVRRLYGDQYTTLEAPLCVSASLHMSPLPGRTGERNGVTMTFAKTRKHYPTKLANLHNEKPKL